MLMRTAECSARRGPPRGSAGLCALLTAVCITPASAFLSAGRVLPPGAALLARGTSIGVPRGQSLPPLPLRSARLDRHVAGREKWGGDAAVRPFRRSPLLSLSDGDASEGNQAQVSSPSSPSDLTRTPVKTVAAYALLFTLCFLFAVVSPAAVQVALLVDYYGTVLPLCGIIFASEAAGSSLLDKGKGLAWSAACLFLGSPFCCAYVLKRLVRQKTLMLQAHPQPAIPTANLNNASSTPTPAPPVPPPSPPSSSTLDLNTTSKGGEEETVAVEKKEEGGVQGRKKIPKAAVFLYSVMLGICFVGQGSADAVEMALTVDFYGSVIPLCGFICFSEKRIAALLWSLGCVVLGAPLCCAYVLMRLLRHKTLQGFRYDRPVPLNAA